MLKAYLGTERSQEEKRRMKVEADRIESKAQLVKKSANVYLSSDEGRIAIRKAAKSEFFQIRSINDSTTDSHGVEAKSDNSRRYVRISCDEL